MELNGLYQKAIAFEFLTVEEGMFLFENAALTELMFVADELRKKQVPHGKVTWQIDRNVNTTNVCIANCKFCNFYRIPGHKDAYITDIETYKKKIEETIKYGGDQLLLQGGHHPELGLSFYVNLQVENYFTFWITLGAPLLFLVINSCRVLSFLGFKKPNVAGLKAAFERETKPNKLSARDLVENEVKFFGEKKD